MRIVCISDTHGQHSALTLPEGDILVHTGDATRRGTRAQIEAFNDWLGTIPFRHKIIIAGNHDFGFEQKPEARTWITNATYLQDREVVVEGLRFYGSPWQPRFFDWAFNLDRGAPLREVWARVPANIDVLLTHGPPHRIMDRTANNQHVGCEELTLALQRIRPRLHVFGHIHEAYGQMTIDGTRYVNASTCNLAYQPVHPPVVVEL